MLFLYLFLTIFDHTFSILNLLPAFCFTFLSATTVSTQVQQQRSAALANSVLQAQLAQNVAARAQLLSNRTQELNNYSIAIDEMLRSLNALPTESGPSNTAPTAPSSGSNAEASQSQGRASRTSSEDGIMRGPMPTSSGIRSRTASAGSSSGVSAGPSTSRSTPAATAASAPPVPTLGNTGYGRIYSSSILPGSLRAGVGRPSAFLVSPAGLQTAVRLGSPGATATPATSSSGVPSPPPPPLGASRANWMPPATASLTSTAETLLDADAEDDADSDPDAEAYADSFEVEDDDEGEDYSVSMESADQRELGALSVHSFQSMEGSVEGNNQRLENGEQDDEGEEEEEAAPLDDLLPTLSFNELGQSLMDVRAARVRLNQETALQLDADADSRENGKTSSYLHFKLPNQVLLIAAYDVI